MKAIYFNLLLILVFPALVLANPVHDKNWKGKYTKEKKISLRYNLLKTFFANIFSLFNLMLQIVILIKLFEYDLLI